MSLELSLFYRFGIALAIGLLIGLQREFVQARHKSDATAGLRTFALVGLAGGLAAMMAERFNSPLVFVTAIAGHGILVLVGYIAGVRKGEVGMTTEVTLFVMFLLGALCYWDYLKLAAALAVSVTALLSLKLEVQAFVRKITRQDLFATIKFAVISAVILPILPKTPIGPPPFDVVTPYNAWFMVVLISGINFLGYAIVKTVGPGHGIGITGFLGGMVSSTATTVSLAERSQAMGAGSGVYARGILSSWMVMFFRVVIVLMVFNPQLAPHLSAPLIMCGILTGFSALFIKRLPEKELTQIAVVNPFKFQPAFKFGVLYASIMIVTQLAKTYLSNTALYVTCFISGFADMDSITLSMCRMANGGGTNITYNFAARAILLAVFANTLIKGVIVMWMGSKSLRKTFLPYWIWVSALCLGAVLWI